MLQAQAILASVRPRDQVGKTRKRIAAEHLAEAAALEAKIKASSKELKALVIARGSHLMDLTGVGPVVAARILADVARFTDRSRFASWTGTAPLDASSGELIRHRLSRAGNRKATTSSTSPPPARSVSTVPAGPTTGGSSPPARPAGRPCAA